MSDIPHAILQTLVAAMVGGTGLVILARKLRIPIIVPLLIGGVLLGPEFAGILQPEVLGRGLQPFIGLAVALILFEGGLDLEMEGFRNASGVIRRLLSIGVLTTFAGVAVLILLLFDFSVQFSILAASLVIVTGPTVVTPLLRRIKVKSRINDILYWEGVLIDPIGVFIAVLCYEWMQSQPTDVQPWMGFILRFVVGVGVGWSAGWAVIRIIRKGWVGEEHSNIFSISTALFTYGLCETLAPESGLLGVVVTGFVLGLERNQTIRQYRKLKEEIGEFLIAVIFMILAARLDLGQFLLLGWDGLFLILGIILIVRPAAVFLSTWGEGLPLREKLFLSWMAPRGIVAASMASLFALNLGSEGFSESPFLESFTYALIATTVIVQGLSARWVAGLLGVRRPEPTGWLIVGAHKLGRTIAGFLREVGDLKVTLLDTNPNHVQTAQQEGFNALERNALEMERISDHEDFQDIGYALALTDNHSANTLICQKWSQTLGRDHCYRWAPNDEAHDEAPGWTVWCDLASPSSASHELEKEIVTAIRFEADQPENPNTDLVLGAILQGKAVWTHRKNIEGKADSSPRLALRREKPKLSQVLHPNLIILRCGKTDIEGLFESVVEHISTFLPHLPKDETVTGLLERERNFPTGLGHRVAVPHFYIPTLREPMLAVVTLENGIDFHAHDNLPVRLAFILLSPTDEPQRHLDLLASIARLAWKAQVIEGLLEADNPPDFLDILRNFEATLPS